MNSLLREIVPNAFCKLLSSIYRKFFKRKSPVYIENIFGFDLYQNNNDIVDYLLRNYGAGKYRKYTDLLLIKGKSVELVEKLW